MVTSAGMLMETINTLYNFHTVITDRETAYSANLRCIVECTARAVQLTDLLGQRILPFQFWAVDLLEANHANRSNAA